MFLSEYLAGEVVLFCWVMWWFLVGLREWKAYIGHEPGLESVASGHTMIYKYPSTLDTRVSGVDWVCTVLCV